MLIVSELLFSMEDANMEAVLGTALRSMYCLEGCPILGPFRTPWLLLGQLSIALIESASFFTDALSRLADDSAPVKQLRGKLRKDARNSPTDVSLLLESKARSKAKAST